MSLKLVVDMNLSTQWVSELARHGFSAVHWSDVGDPRATDAVIMEWARTNGYVVFTHDLGFGTALSLTHAVGPSVLQVRTQTVLPEDIGSLVVTALRAHATTLAALPRRRGGEGFARPRSPTAGLSSAVVELGTCGRNLKPLWRAQPLRRPGWFQPPRSTRRSTASRHPTNRH